MTTTQNMTGVELNIARWLSAFALQSDDEGILLEGFAERLAAAALPVVRIASGSEVFHPIIDARGLRWYPGRGIERTDFARDAVEDEDWPRSPVYHMRENDLTELRRTLGRSYRQGEFPMLDRFVHEGATDYLAFLIGFAREATLGAVPGRLHFLQRRAARAASSPPRSTSCAGSRCISRTPTRRSRP